MTRGDIKDKNGVKALEIDRVTDRRRKKITASVFAGPFGIPLTVLFMSGPAFQTELFSYSNMPHVAFCILLLHFPLLPSASSHRL